MELDVHHNRVCVISDVHMGSPLFRNMNSLQSFIRYARENNYHLCINGDGLDITQSSISRMAEEIPIIFNELIALRNAGLEIYYIVGNHDIIFEYFLKDWGLFKVVPFINLVSNNKRIRIEHSHLYDKIYMSSPTIYRAVEIVAGFFLKYTPPLYKFFLYFERLLYGDGNSRGSSVYNTSSSFRVAVDNLLERGFDAVIFGHTHRPGKIILQDKKTYINLGAWAVKPYYATIINGEIELSGYSK